MFDSIVQPTLFDGPVEIVPPGCLYPGHAASSGYSFGCRCVRCKSAKALNKSGVCRFVGCVSPRIVGAGYCVVHDLCRRPGCTNPRRRVQAAQYCEEHTTATNLAPRSVEERRTIGTPAVCETCCRDFVWYQSVLDRNVRLETHDLCRRVCAVCRKLFMKTVRAHSLSPDMAVRLIKATECELCGNRFARTESGRVAKVVDHDHECCGPASESTPSCGRCVRGIICHRCNRDVAGYEHLARTVGHGRMAEYLDASHRV
jgi:hypothetical protein